MLKPSDEASLSPSRLLRKRAMRLLTPTGPNETKLLRGPWSIFGGDPQPNVNIIGPGYVDTGVSSRAMEALKKRAKKAIEARAKLGVPTTPAMIQALSRRSGIATLGGIGGTLPRDTHRAKTMNARGSAY